MEIQVAKVGQRLGNPWLAVASTNSPYAEPVCVTSTQKAGISGPRLPLVAGTIVFRGCAEATWGPWWRPPLQGLDQAVVLPDISDPLSFDLV